MGVTFINFQIPPFKSSILYASQMCPIYPSRVLTVPLILKNIGKPSMNWLSDSIQETN